MPAGPPPRHGHRRRRPATEPKLASDVMDRVLARLGGDGRILERRVFKAFTDSVGGVLAARTAPEQLRGTTLFVLVASSALAHELTLLKQPVLERLAKALGAGIVTDLRTRVGPLGRGS